MTTALQDYDMELGVVWRAGHGWTYAVSGVRLDTHRPLGQRYRSIGLHSMPHRRVRRLYVTYAADSGRLMEKA